MEVPGLNESVQLLNVTFNGTATALRLGGQLVHFTGHELKELLKFIVARHNEYKNRPKTVMPGEKDIFDFLKLCNDNNESVGAVTIDKASIEDFANFANEKGVSFSQMFATSGDPDRVTILYRQSEAYAFQGYVMTHSDTARMSSIEEYQQGIIDTDRQNADIMAGITPERLKAFSEMLDGDRKNDVFIPVKESQISGVSEKVCEIRMQDDDGRVFFTEFPRESLVFDGKGYKLKTDTERDYDSYGESGFTVLPDGKITAKERTDNTSRTVSGRDMERFSKNTDKPAPKVLFVNEKDKVEKTGKNLIDFQAARQKAAGIKPKTSGKVR